MRAITAILFDLDGTLIDSAPDLRAALNVMLEAEGRRSLRLEEVTRIVGDGVAVLVERALALTGGLPDGGTGGEETARLTARYVAIYESMAADLTRPYPGVPEALQQLRASGFKLGICTNKPERATRAILSDLDLDRYFAAIAGGDTVPGVRKPDPRHLQAVLAGLGATAEDAVMVGDSVNDVLSARAAGMPVIVRAGGYGPVPTAELGADIVIEDFAELTDAIRRLS